MRRPCTSELPRARRRGWVAALLGLAGVAVGIAVATGGGETAAPAAGLPAAAAPVAEPAVPAVPAVASVAAAPPPVDSPSRQLLLPDGTSVPALNGAVDAAPLARYWGPWPWSPIREVVRDRGVDWYRHDDGSFSTTQMVWRSDLGREAAMTRVAHPGPTPPASR